MLPKNPNEEKTQPKIPENQNEENRSSTPILPWPRSYVSAGAAVGSVVTFVVTAFAMVWTVRHKNSSRIGTKLADKQSLEMILRDQGYTNNVASFFAFHQLAWKISIPGNMIGNAIAVGIFSVVCIASSVMILVPGHLHNGIVNKHEWFTPWYKNDQVLHGICEVVFFITILVYQLGHTVTMVIDLAYRKVISFSPVIGIAVGLEILSVCISIGCLVFWQIKHAGLPPNECEHNQYLWISLASIACYFLTFPIFLLGAEPTMVQPKPGTNQKN